MRKFAATIESSTPPPINSIWIKDGEAKYFSKGDWRTLTESSEDRKELEEKVDSLDKEVGNITTDISKINAKQSIIELEIGNSEDVKARNLEKLKAIQTTDHTFFTDINFGYGTGKWLPTTGGSAFIVTAEGVSVDYTIDIDGSIAKVKEVNLNDVDNSLFEIVSTLPTENISKSKIYCVPTTKTGDKNQFVEYAYLLKSDGTYDWEELGKFEENFDIYKYIYPRDDFGNVNIRTSSSVSIIAGTGVVTLNSEYLDIKNITQMTLPDTFYIYSMNSKIIFGYHRGIILDNDINKITLSDDLSIGLLIEGPSSKLRMGHDILELSSKDLPLKINTPEVIIPKVLKIADIDDVAASILDAQQRISTLENKSIPAATKTTIGGIKAGINIVNIADVDNATAPQVAGVVNTLLEQLRAAGVLVS